MLAKCIAPASKLIATRRGAHGFSPQHFRMCLGLVTGNISRPRPVICWPHARDIARRQPVCRVRQQRRGAARFQAAADMAAAIKGSVTQPLEQTRGLSVCCSSSAGRRDCFCSLICWEAASRPTTSSSLRAACRQLCPVLCSSPASRATR